MIKEDFLHVCLHQISGGKENLKQTNKITKQTTTKKQPRGSNFKSTTPVILAAARFSETSICPCLNVY